MKCGIRVLLLKQTEFTMHRILSPPNLTSFSAHCSCFLCSFVISL